MEDTSFPRNVLQNYSTNIRQYTEIFRQYSDIYSYLRKMSSPEAILEKYWGYKAFRPMQKDIIESILSQQDTLALLATGGGKSITYQVPALMMKGICIVISPLIALMQDQLTGLKSKGIKALAINSFMSKKEIDIALDNCVYGNYKFLFVSPERLNSTLFIDRLKKMEISFITIDEAHCISQWGHNFRPDYLRIAEIREIHDKPFLALTATATRHVITDIQEQLQFKNSVLIRGGFERPNLQFNVTKSSDKMGDILKLLKNTDEVAIIYTRSRADTAKIASFLQDHGVMANHYHAGLSQTERQGIQDDWMAEKNKVIVATNAFGMGIDKPNVRKVIHYTMCDNPEAYFQEVGRAGRDQKEASIHLLYNSDDLITVKYRVEQSHPEPAYVRDLYHHLCMNYQLAIGSGLDEEFTFDLHTFCTKYKLRIFAAHAALRYLEMNNHIVLNDGFHHASTLHIIVDRHAIEHFLETQPKLSLLLNTVLRSYTHLFTQELKIRETELCSRTGLSYFEVKDQLTIMQKLGILEYVPSHDQAMIRFLNPREQKEHLTLDVNSMKIRKSQALFKLMAMTNYVNNDDICRSLILLHYFNQSLGKNCGKCDNCRKKKSVPHDQLIKFKNAIISQCDGISIEVSDVLNGDYGLDKSQLKSSLRWLIDEGSVILNNGKIITN